jgi:hypothetical protein
MLGDAARRIGDTPADGMDFPVDDDRRHMIAGLGSGARSLQVLVAGS